MVAITAPVIWRIDFDAASFAESPSAAMSVCVFSTTTIASSTSDPITRMRPNIVRMLIVKPNAQMNTNAARSEIGIATTGTSVARRSWRNSHVISTTRASARKSVATISCMNTRVNAVASLAISHVTPSGRRFIQSSSVAFTRSTTSRAFASGVLYTESPMDSRPLNALRPA